MKVILFSILEILLVPFYIGLIVLEKLIGFLYKIIVKPRYAIRFTDWIVRIEEQFLKK